MEVLELTARLTKAREKADDVDRERSRLTGENDNQKKQLTELGTSCKQDFECGIDDLADLIEQAEQEATKTLTDAETVLGLRGAEAQPVAGVAAPVEEGSILDQDALV